MTLHRMREHLRVNREENTESKALMTYAYFVSGVWWLVSLFAVFVCYMIASLVWDVRPSFWPALTISSAIMTATWIVLAIKARRRGYADVCEFRLKVTWLLSLGLASSLCASCDLSTTGRVLLFASFTALWIVAHLLLQKPKAADPQEDAPQHTDALDRLGRKRT